jgi:parvulin-like peptidyl-prolyl isomerase
MREKLAGDELRRRIYAGKLDIHESELREVYERYYYTLRVRHLNVDRRDLAEEILTRLNAGEDFGILASRYSQHEKTAKLGGDMGEVTAGRMIIHFEDAVFPLSPGELTGVIKGKGENYKIFKLENKVRDRTPPAPFEEMRVPLAKRVRIRKAGDALYAWQLRMFEEYGAEIDEENYTTFAGIMRDKIASWEAVSAVYPDSLTQAWIFAGWPQDVLGLSLFHFHGAGGGQLTVARFNMESRKSLQPISLWRNSDVQLRQFVKGAGFDLLHAAERQKIIDERLPIVETEVKRRMEDRMTKMVGSTLTTYADEIPVPEARAYWEQHKDEYTRPAQARARRIAVETEAQARDIRRRLEGGADFAALAERFSKDDATSRRGGETPLFGPGSMQGMGDVALKHEPGDLIPIFRSRLGWEVIEVLEKIPARLQTFEEAKEAVTVRLATDRTNAELDRVIVEARQATRIEIDEETLDRLRLPS